MVEITTSPEAYARYLDMQGDNPSYSAGNIALMLKQGPEGSTIFFTRERWKPQGRSVLDDQQDKGSKIFVKTTSGRGYTLADAFDISQTQGARGGGGAPPPPLPLFPPMSIRCGFVIDQLS